MVEELTHDTKIEGLNPGTKPTGREKTKCLWLWATGGSAVIGNLTYVDKLKDLNIETVAPGRGKGGSKYLRLWASTGSTVVEELTHDTKIEGLKLETKATGRE